MCMHGTCPNPYSHEAVLKKNVVSLALSRNTEWLGKQVVGQVLA